MSDTNFSYMEVSAKRKKRNQFISVLIIVAIVLLGVIVWGWIELQKSRNAERIKNALNSQVEPGFKEPEAGTEPFTDSGKIVLQDTAKSIPKPVPAPEPVAKPMPEPTPKPEVAAIPEPKPVSHPKPKHQTVKPSEPAVSPEPVAIPEPAKPQPPAVKPKPEPVVKPAPEPIQVAMRKPEPTPAPKAVVPPPAVVPAPAPVKAFPPEDLPLPEKVEPTDEARQAVVALPAPAPRPAASPEAGAATDAGSNNFKLGISAYKQQDYVNAIRSFSALSKPTSKKRGAQDREEYVQGNFLKGVSLLKVGHMSEAVSAFQNVLEYEKYYPLANMNLGICYVELKQYSKAHQAFEAVIRDQSFIEPAVFDDVMQRTKYFWALAWTRLYKNSTNPDKQNYYRQQATLKWKDYEVWFSKNDKYKNENLKAENYLKSISDL